MNQVAFIGLGNMGSPMAANLIKAGCTLRVFDLNQAAMATLAELGATTCESIEQAVQGVDTVITMLPAGEHVRSVYLGDHQGNAGLLTLLAPKTLLIDSSTIDPQSAKTVAAEAQKQGLEFVDAPVSVVWQARRRGRSPSSLVARKRRLTRRKPFFSTWAKISFTLAVQATGKWRKSVTT